MPFILLLPLATGLQWAASRRPDLVESVYANGLYPLLARLFALLTGWIPVAVGEIVIMIVVVGAGATALRAVARVLRKRRSLGNVLLHALVNLLAAAGLLYGWGLLGWGLNYQREPFAAAAGLDASATRASELDALCGRLVELANAERQLVLEGDDGAMRLRESRPQTMKQAETGFRRAGLRYELLQEPVIGTPKAMLLSRVFVYFGIRGYYLMHTAEPHINMEVPDSEFPMTVCHELAHQQGFAREDEANFVGYVACTMNHDPDFRYSAALEALIYALGALSRESPERWQRHVERLHPGVRRDWDAQRRFWQAYDTPVRAAGARINDAYLKLQGQEEGVRSYDRMIELLIFDARAAGRELPIGRGK